MTLHCKLVESLSEGDALWCEWLALMERVRPGLRIHGPHWYHIWRETLGSRGRWTGRPLIVTARDDGGALVGLLPLGEQRFGPMSVFSIGGDWQPARTILADAAREYEVGRALGEYVAATQWLALRMGPCVRSAPCMQGFRAALDDNGVFAQRQRSEPLAIYAAETTWDGYRAEVLGKKFDKRIKYYEKRLGRVGQVEIVHFRQPSAEETARMVHDLGSVERRSWLGKIEKGYLRFAPEASAAMWTRLIVEALSPADQVDCWILYLDGTPVSFSFNLTALPVRYILANNYDETVRIHSTGSVLYRRMMQDGLERGVTYFDFGGSEIHYKSRWGASYQDESENFLFVPNTVLGGAAKPMTRLHGWARPHLETLLQHPRLAPLTGHPRFEFVARNLGIAVPARAGESGDDSGDDERAGTS